MLRNIVNFTFFQKASLESDETVSTIHHGGLKGQILSERTKEEKLEEGMMAKKGWIDSGKRNPPQSPRLAELGQMNPEPKVKSSTREMRSNGKGKTSSKVQKKGTRKSVRF